MKALLLTLLAGLLFGLGLVLSGMADPKIVLGFLTWDARWNPALLIVMAGALSVTVPGFAWMRRRGRPFLAADFSQPAVTAVDRRLVLGALLFGLGWGLAGFCPGPAIVSAGLLQPAALLFLPAMFAGGWLVLRLEAYLK
jgi:uncharacterized membrane protein YedE/YeeE